MKTPALKLNIFKCHFAYGGNGGISSEHPHVREWCEKWVTKVKKDPRVGEVFSHTISDTPVTMSRNKAVTLARQAGAHLLLMIDSDQGMLLHDKDPGHIDFWDAAFPFLYDHYGKGPACVGAPYCGPPNGTENVYVFQWGNRAIRGDETRFSLDQYTRNEAASMAGIQACAALPTGCILFDLRCFDIIEPCKLSKQSILEKVQSGDFTVEDGLWALRDGFFYYEWADQYADQKASTEDVTCTRDISLAGYAKLGYNPVYCAWDSWVGHWKPWNVGKPQRYGVEQISANFSRVVLDRHHSDDRIIDAGQFTNRLPPSSKPTIIVKPKPEPPPDWRTFHKTPAADTEALADLVKGVLAEKDQCRVLEVGTWLGNTAIAMADAGAEVHCIDTWEGTVGDNTGDLAKLAGSPDAIYEEFLNRIGHRYNRTIFPDRRASQVAAKFAWPKKFDLIFLDANHSYEALKADIEAWLPHLAEGGIICGHDYTVGAFPGVAKAVHEHFGKKRVTHLGNAIWAVFPQLEPVA